MPGYDYLDRLRASQETPENAPILEAAERLFGVWRRKGDKINAPYNGTARRLMALAVRNFGLDDAGAVDTDRMRALAEACDWYAHAPGARTARDGHDWYKLDRMFGSPEKIERLLLDSAGWKRAPTKPKLNMWGDEIGSEAEAARFRELGLDAEGRPAVPK